jgi:hypothetical protein
VLGCCAVVLWCCDALLLWCWMWFCSAVVLWCCGVVLWCCGAVVMWCCGAVRTTGDCILRVKLRGLRSRANYTDRAAAAGRRNTESYVEEKCQLDATDEIFIADLIACSTCFRHLYAHHQEL